MVFKISRNEAPIMEFEKYLIQILSSVTYSNIPYNLERILFSKMLSSDIFGQKLYNKGVYDDQIG